MNIRETSDFENKTSIGTYHGKSFSLGVTTRELDSQSNRFTSNQSIVFSIKYTQEKDDRPGIAYSKYLLNDNGLETSDQHHLEATQIFFLTKVVFVESKMEKDR